MEEEIQLIEPFEVAACGPGFGHVAHERDDLVSIGILAERGTDVEVDDRRVLPPPLAREAHPSLPADPGEDVAGVARGLDDLHVAQREPVQLVDRVARDGRGRLVDLEEPADGIEDDQPIHRGANDVDGARRGASAGAHGRALLPRPERAPAEEEECDQHGDQAHAEFGEGADRLLCLLQIQLAHDGPGGATDPRGSRHDLGPPIIDSLHARLGGTEERAARD